MSQLDVVRKFIVAYEKNLFSSDDPRIDFFREFLSREFKRQQTKSNASGLAQWLEQREKARQQAAESDRLLMEVLLGGGALGGGADDADNIQLQSSSSTEHKQAESSEPEYVAPAYAPLSGMIAPPDQPESRAEEAEEADVQNQYEALPNSLSGSLNILESDSPQADYKALPSSGIQEELSLESRVHQTVQKNIIEAGVLPTPKELETMNRMMNPSLWQGL